MIKLFQEGVEIPVDYWKFPTGETGVKITGNINIAESSYISVRVNFENNDDIINCLQVVNALKNLGVSDYRVIVDIPYLPYSRQDRVCHPGEAFSLEVIIQVLKTMKVLVRTYDLHSQVAFHDLGADFLMNVPQFVCAAELPNHDFLIAPDKGAARKMQDSSGQFHERIVTLSKTRVGGKVIYEDFTEVELSGKVCVIDDLCDGGNTFVALGEMIRRLHPKITEFNLYVTHGAFTQGIEKISEIYDNIYCNNFMNSKGLVDADLNPKLKLI